MTPQEKMVSKQFFVPEVIQTSEMDCGPASLKSLLEGYGIHASYGRLREACQTSVDGTSIDSIEDLAVKLGLDAEQIMLPIDHVLLEGLEALPALVVTRTPGGLTHFVVAWNLNYGWVQIMDPGVGRRWMRREKFLEEIFRHTFPVPASAWREWAGTSGFLAPLSQRMRFLKINDFQIENIQNEAQAIPGWIGMASLDAAIRLIEALVKAKAIKTGAESQTLLFELFRANSKDLEDPAEEKYIYAIPKGYWSVSPQSVGNDQINNSINDSELMLLLSGAVLIKVNGIRENITDHAEGAIENELSFLEEEETKLAPEIASILQEPRNNIEKKIWETLRQDGWLVPTVLIGAFLITACGVALQAFLIQGLFQFQNIFFSFEDRVYALSLLFIFLISLFLLELPLRSASHRVGRRLETRLRIAFLQKIPLLSDRYFHSRLTSDMTSRAHGLRSLRKLPGLVVSFLLSVFGMLSTIAGIVWLQPESIFFAFCVILLFGLFGWLSHSILEESDMRMRTHSGALSRFYLDALQGLLPLRTHGAERAFRREYEGLLTEWMRSNADMMKTGLGVQAASSILYVLFSAWVGFDYIRGGGPAGGGLLLFYWTLNLPVYGQSIVGFIQQYPNIRNNLLRVLEPLDAAEENLLPKSNINQGEPGFQINVDLNQNSEINSDLPGGAAIELLNVDIVAGGHTILQSINLNLCPGEHLAIVGPSGAGKSSLVGILLGWHTPAGGQCLLDGIPLEGQTLLNLRRQTVWVDPAVQLWNKSLLENLKYGNNGTSSDIGGLRIEDADLHELLKRLDNGLQTNLGEGGGLVSGGEGQRVRLGRAMNRNHVRLVVLDEPFRGLDRNQRRKLLVKVREFWKNATLICVTHDVSETQDFERVLVIDNGQIIEDGSPIALKKLQKSRYSKLLHAEEQVRKGIWASKYWRHLYMENGQLTEKS